MKQGIACSYVAEQQIRNWPKGQSVSNLLGKKQRIKKKVSVITFSESIGFSQAEHFYALTISPRESQKIQGENRAIQKHGAALVLGDNKYWDFSIRRKDREGQCWNPAPSPQAQLTSMRPDTAGLSDMTFNTTHSPQNRGQCPSRLPEPQPSPTHRVQRLLSTSAQGIHFVTWGLACRPCWLAAMNLSYHMDVWRLPASLSSCLIQHRAPQNSFS